MNRLAADRERSREAALFAALCVVLSALCYFLFYNQALSGGTGPYVSDLPVYIDAALGKDILYPVPYRLYFATISLAANLLPVAHAAAAATTLYCVLTYVLLFLYLRRFLREAGPDDHSGTIAAAAAFSLLFASMIILPFFNVGNLYLGQFSPNPWHNATYLATRPFTVVVFFEFAALLKGLGETLSRRSLILFTLSLFLSTYTKPSFSFVFIPAAGLILLWRLIRDRGRCFKQLAVVGLCFIPTFADLLRQYFSVFGAAGSSEIGFGLAAVWKSFSPNILVSILLSSLFPLFVLAFNVKALGKHSWFMLSWSLYLCGLLEALICFETGERMLHGNFMWSYMHGLFFVFLSCLALLLADRSPARKGYKAAAYLIFAVHLVSGLLYFFKIISGGSYF